MSTNEQVRYTAEQVERQASILSDTWGVGEAYKMLRAYAKTLRQSSAPAGVVSDEYQQSQHDVMDAAAKWWKFAQAAGVPGAVKWLRNDETGGAVVYTRGEYADRLIGFVCSLGQAALSATEPAAQAEAVAIVRHFDYRGIARNGFSQEAQMLDGAPALPDGAKLYTAPPAQPAERVPEVVLQNLAQISDGATLSREEMQDMAAEAYNVLARATSPGTPAPSESKGVKGVDRG